MLILSLADCSARLIFFLNRDMKQKTKNLLKNITRIIQYVFSIVMLTILLVGLIGLMLLIDAYFKGEVCFL